ncbi:membrane protein required for colicin V production [Sphingomonas jejuensis]|uniref:Membrane protein required for colicin V production n=1 Tax=Sphingomonas jejuensis TaxID=904715 RepID=A0ABX0XLI2_9SPHN|nr:CvpA family protein [Sphingomonas jejuensis]NJC33575.1 membrane protein required for colicin V production [Sphingomonas jejuensis]
MGLTALDIIVILLVGGGAVFGALRGFVTETLSLIAWVAAVAAVSLFQDPLTARLEPSVGTYYGAAVLAFAILFGATYLGGKLVAKAIGARTRSSVLGPVDRVLGLGFGALKGLIISTLLFLLATMVVDTVRGGAANRPEWIRDARTFPLLNATGKAMSDYIDERRNPDRVDSPAS